MTLFYSLPFETLQPALPPRPYHTVIVGSGYGAALAALAIAMRQNKPFQNEDILVIERGAEYLPGEFPKTLADVLGFISTQGNDEARTGYADSLFDVRVGNNVNAIVGSGLGGTSLINAGVAVDPDDRALRDWPEPEQGSETWMDRLTPSIEFVRALLDVKQHPNGFGLAKVAALKSLGASMVAPPVFQSDDDVAGRGLTATHMLADIAVTFENGPNSVGVEQRKCNDCGNCFTGCNTGAKNTLAMNAWPLARSLGITIVTGGNVERIKRGPGTSHPWLVVASRTTDANPSRPSRIGIAAKRVILAAGTFGSTEILHRSNTKDKDGACLELSGRLGSRFSLNGDGIAFGFGQRQRVNGCAKVPSADGIDPRAGEMPGPTIVSFLQVAESGGDPANRGFIEDATIPQAIARLWAEALSTQAMTRGYIPGPSSAWHQDHPQSDPLSVSADLMDHHQALLLMGVDDAAGTLGFDPKWDHLRVQWPPRQTDVSLPGDRIERWQDRILQRAAQSGGFDGGQYLESLLWQPLPPAFNQAFEGASDLGGVHLCNHPLGGCSMAADARGGVVDTRGRVFDSDIGASVYEGLYVFDGSIIPGALGINPFVTIAALAHHLAGQLDGEPAEHPEVPLSNWPPAPIRCGQKIDWPVPPLGFVFHERLVGPTEPSQEAQIAAIFKLPPPENDYDDAPRTNSVVIDIDIQIPDVYAWLEDPSQYLKANFTVYPNENWPRTIDTVSDSDLGEAFIRNTQGVVQLFARDVEPPPVVWRGFLAIWRFLLLRRDEIPDMARGSGTQSGCMLSRLKGFLRVAGQHAKWRYFRYSCSLPIGDTVVRVSGEKRLAYDGWSSRRVRDESNLWTTLSNIKLNFVDAAGRSAGAWFRVDVVRMAQDLTALQCTTNAETPHIAAAAGSIAALAARAFLQTHLWSFGAPSYENFWTAQEVAEEYDLFKPPKFIYYKGPKGAEKFTVTVENGANHWRLMKAAPGARNGKPPILLIHGISHSSRVFHTDTLDVNLAGFLLKEGYDVWILDHGLSTALDHGKTYHPAIDDVSKQVSQAVKYVYQHGSDSQGILVFSHCIGAATLSMSILRGDLMDAGRPMIVGVVMHAVPPWIHASAVNLVRAYAGVAFRSRFFPDVINPIPPRRKRGEKPPTAFDQLIDRVGSSLPWSCKEYHLHSRCGREAKFARAICNRMTLFYGYEWLHGNLNKGTHREFASLMGPANVDAYRQLYFFVNRGRVTDKEGANRFVQEDKLKRYWTFPTMFLHGRENEAFNVESSYLSAHQLLQIRALMTPPTAPVELKVVGKAPNDQRGARYGHLDVLLGNRAYEDCFKPVLEFLTSVREQPEIPQPKTATLAPTRVMSGPIISRPKRLDDGRHQLRIWSETNEFQTSPTGTIEYECARAPGGVLRLIHWIRGGEVGDQQLMSGSANTNVLKNSVFWLGDFEVTAMSDGVRPRADSGGGLVNIKMRGSIRAAMKVPRSSATPGVASASAPAPVPIPASASASASAAVNVSAAAPANIPDSSLNWTTLPWYQRFISDCPFDGVSFILGSCWYPGSWFDQQRSDRIFAKVQDAVIHQPGIDHLLLVGDQIYADASYGIFDIAENRERFQQSYRRAFLSPWASWVLSHVPTYFAIDDHEFRDSYPTWHSGDLDNYLTRHSGDNHTLRKLGKAAIHEAWNFLIHSEETAPAGSNLHDNRLWHHFESRGFQYFVFDTRSERDPGALGLRRIISETQENAFVAWAGALSSHERPAFLVTGSSLAPIPTDEIDDPALASTSDGLRAYPEFVSLIGSEMIGRQSTLILLSGDPHFSSVCEFTLSNSSENWSIPCIAIISSGVNVPLPFANDVADDYEWDVALPPFDPLPQCVSLSVNKSTLLSNGRAHVLHIDITPDGAPCWRLSVSAIDADSTFYPAPIIRRFEV